MTSSSAKEIDKKILRDIYLSNECAKNILDYFAGRTNNSRETPVDRLMYLMENRFTKNEIISALKEFQSIGAGKFITGRHGKKSRMEWTVEPISLGKAAKGEGTAIEPIVESQSDSANEEESAVPYQVIRHQYMLRAGFTVSIDLPDNLTKKEATRLGDFIRTLPFEDVDNN